MKSITNPHARTARILVVVSALLLTGIVTMASISYAGARTQGKVVSGQAAAVLTIWCNPPTSTDACFDRRTVDLNSDGTPDIEIYSRHVVSKVTGVMAGTSVMLQTLNVNLTTHTSIGEFTAIFTGTIGNSEPGSMMTTGAFTTDLSQYPTISWEGNLQAVEGSGMGGLNGVCGGGNYQGSGGGGAPLTSTSNYEFRFGEACNSNP